MFRESVYSKSLVINQTNCRTLLQNQNKCLLLEDRVHFLPECSWNFTVSRWSWHGWWYSTRQRGVLIPAVLGVVGVVPPAVLAGLYYTQLVPGEGVVDRVPEDVLRRALAGDVAAAAGPGGVPGAQAIQEDGGRTGGGQGEYRRGSLANRTVD